MEGNRCSIRIVTDSTCDLPQEVTDRYQITVVPVYVNIDGQSYLDGVELSREEFYTNLPRYHSVPTTSAPGPGTFTHIYEQLAQEGATAIISIHISSILSNTFNVAQMGAQATNVLPVTVFDTGQITLGVGLLVLTAVQAVDAGHSLEETMAILHDKARRTHSFAALDTLEFLRRSG